MKKLIGILLSTAIALSACQLVFADGGMDKILISVKNKVDIPDELTEFNTNYYTDELGITSYSFSWEDKESNNSINIETDADGNITNYYRSCSDWYRDENTVKIDKDFDITQITSVSDNLLQKLVPSLFESASDKLESVEYDDKYKISSNARYEIRYIRKHHGTEVKDNYAYVTVRNTSNGYIAASANINWDYTNEFVYSDASAMSIENAHNVMDTFAAPILQYRKDYNNEYFLEYVKDGGVYIDACSGKLTEEYDVYDALYKESVSEDSSAGGGSGLSRAEITELENMAKLKSPSELFNIMLSRPELGIDANTDTSTLRSNTYKIDDNYFTSLYVKESDKNSDYSHAYFNASTGEMLSFSRYSSDRSSSEPDEKDIKSGYDFLNKYYLEKLSLCDSGDGQGFYTRLVYDIPYVNNSLSVTVSGNKIKSFNISWDDDISEIPKPENIISKKEASDAVYKAYPLKLQYISAKDSDGKLTLCYTHDVYDIKINAFDASPVDYDNTNVTASYIDADEHWVKNIADTLCLYGIKFDGNSLNPDEKITQKDFLKLVYSGIFGYTAPENHDILYNSMASIISDDEKNPEAPISRETAICYILRAIGIKETAEIKGIYICGFDDSDSISKDKFGYCAIAKGLGIVKGCENKLHPAENITRAEALTMIYNYLTR